MRASCLAAPLSIFFFLRRRPLSSSSSLTIAGGGDKGGRVACYLRRARLIDSIRLRLRSSSPFPLPRSSYLDSFVAAQIIRCAPSPDSAISFLRSLPDNLRANTALLRPLAKRLAAARRHDDLASLLSSLDLSPMELLRISSIAGDLPSALRAFSSLCGSTRRGHPPTESYNLLMSLHVTSASHYEAIDTFAQIVADGANPNSRTYTVVIDHLVKTQQVDRALQVFDLLPSMRIRRTTKQFDVLAEALSLSQRFKELRSLLAEMSADGVLPGRKARLAITAMQEAGFMEGTEEFSEELKPDEQIEYVVDSEEEENDFENNEEDVNGCRLRLKPWLDPTALARAVDGWEAEEVLELEKACFVWTPRLVCKLLRGFKKPLTAWEFFVWVAYQPGGFSHNKQTVSRMITILARHGHLELVDRLLFKVKSEGIRLPFATIRLIIEFYGFSNKPRAAIGAFRDAEVICGPISKANLALLSSSMLRTMTKCDNCSGKDVMDLLEEMMMTGFLPDLQTFAGLLKHFAGEGDLKNVHKMFVMIRQCGLSPDAYIYKVMIRAYCRNEKSALAMRMFDEMRSSGVLPDVSTKVELVKGLWKEGKRREAAMVEEWCEGVELSLPSASPGNAWTVSNADFRRVLEIYAGGFRREEIVKA